MKNIGSADISLLRKINQRMVLDAIYESETTSRTALSKRLKLSKPAIADNLSHLIGTGIVSEVGEGESTAGGGRKPVLISFNKNHKYIIAVDFNYQSPIIVLSNLRNEILGECRVTIDGVPKTSALQEQLRTAVVGLLHQNIIAFSDVQYIGIAAPGVYDDEGRLIFVNIYAGRVKWNEINFKKVFEGIGSGIIIKNDTKAATLGEWQHGNVKNAQGMLYISCGAGLGSGIILGSALYEGSHFAAGEIYNNTDIARLAEGKTFEDVVCIKGLLEHIERRMISGEKTCLRAEDLSIETVKDAYAKKDSLTIQEIESVCDELGLIIYNMVNLLDIETVVFGGEYVFFAPLLFSRFKEKYEKYSRIVPKLKASALQAYSGIHGLLFVCRNAYFDDICG